MAWGVILKWAAISPEEREEVSDRVSRIFRRFLSAMASKLSIGIIIDYFLLK